jgi:N-acetylglutamate synthase-like GNAT family acetyltransferase
VPQRALEDGGAVVVVGIATGLRLRPATAADIDVLVLMINAAYGKSEAHVFGRSDRTDRGNFARAIDGIVVAELDGAIVGSVQVEIGADAAHFGLLAVDIAVQGRGVGTQLIAHAEQMAREAGLAVMKIETVKEAGLRTFYETHGYRAVREAPGQVWNGGADWGAVIDWHMVDMEKAPL